MINIPVIEIISNTIVFLLFAGFSTCVIKNRNILVTTLIGAIVLGVIAPNVCVLMPRPIGFVVAIIIFWLYLQFSFIGTIKEKIITYCIGYMTITFVQVFVMALFSAFKYNVGANSVSFLTCFTLLTAATLFLIVKTWQSIKFVMSNAKFLSFFLLPISQCGLVIMSVLLLSKSSEHNHLNDLAANRGMAIGFVIMIGLSFMADGFFIQSFAKLAEGIKQRERLQSLEAENKITYEHIKNMESDINEMKRYRHDSLNLLTALGLIIESNTAESIEEARRLIREMTKEIAALTGRRYCGCNIVNCILDYEEKKISENGIICSFRAEVPDELKVNEIDLCRIITNLLDNAREGCLAINDDRKKYVSFNMRIVGDYLYITVQNTKNDSVLTFETSKEDSSLHGLGLHIVEEIAQRSGGDLTVNVDEDTVTVTAVMQWDIGE